MNWKVLFFLFQLILLNSCVNEPVLEHAFEFTQLESEKSGVDFSNIIIENDTLNYFNFPFLYLGGGVSIGDINNDHLPDIYFTGNQVPNKLYLNKGNLEFEDITATAGVAGDERWYSGATMVDINQDGWLDIYMSVAGKSGSTTNQLFVNQGDNTFVEESRAFGIDDKSTSIQSTFFDYNNDGLLDLFVANYPIVRVSAGNQYYKDKMVANRFEDSGHLYQNKGDGTFVDVTEASGLRRFGLTLGLVATDFNNDGFKDLYLSNDFNVPDYFYQNNGDGTFSEKTQESFRHTAMFGMGIDAADFNNDGLMDLVQLDMTAEDYKRSKTNMASMRPEAFFEAIEMGFHYQYMQNCLQLNNAINSNGEPLFSDISRIAGMATTDWSWGVIFADLDNDGWKDAFITNGVKRDVNNNDVNLQYENATFWGREEHPDVTLMPSTPISNYAFRNQGDLTFVNATKDWGLGVEGFSNGFAVSDLDNDGDLDIVINNIDQPASIYVNNIPTNKHHFLKVNFKGPTNNPFGLGTKVILKAKGLQQVQELTLTRGYQSSVDPILHFGLGELAIIDELEVIWPNGNRQKMFDIQPNQHLTIQYEKSKPQLNPIDQRQKSLIDITQNCEIAYNHKEDAYNDFINEPLLPHKTSTYGPGIAVGDVNKDGLEDFFVGNARGAAAVLYIQQKDGKFEALPGPWEDDASFEDTGAVLFDVDRDEDLDLYVVSGGNNTNIPNNLYQDRLYLNTQEGFIRISDALPEMNTSGQVVAVFDFDSDGDEDIFVGGRIIPGQYPHPPQSFLLRNDSQNGKVLFSDVTSTVAPELEAPGLVTSAIWYDYDNDGWTDLILAGEWMPIRFFKNHKGIFEEDTQNTGLSELSGWWYSLEKADLDQDGDLDLIAGNLGLNYKYKASTYQPFEVYANDFDENGTSDIVLSYKKGRKFLPVRGRECSSQQVPAIKIRFKTFEAFANASLEDIYGAEILEQSLHYQANTFGHHWFENKGNGKFEAHLLPNEAQLSSINAIQVFHYNQDAYPDLLLAGNLYQSEVETPRGDASIGLILKGTKSGIFEVVPPSETGLMLTGEVREIHSLRIGDSKQTGFLFARNNEDLRLLAFKKQSPL